MKPLKAAAVLAGSLIASGAAAPAFAHSGPAPAGLNAISPLRNVTVLDVPLPDGAKALYADENSLIETVRKTPAALDHHRAPQGGPRQRG
ncbi:hypothetical protein [Streptomyces glaucus]|uniref:Secreted protein n=1 Tax=Streptomyces glaucus TaxID=284029 RepID=A0ABN3J2I7_9ACTN